MKELVARLEGQGKEDREKMTKDSRDKEIVQGRLRSLENELDDQAHDNTKLMATLQQQSVIIKGWEEELVRYKEEFKGMSRQRDSLNKKLKVIEEEKTASNTERDALRVSFLFHWREKIKNTK